MLSNDSISKQHAECMAAIVHACTEHASLCKQVSFFRSNLVLSVVKKPTGRTPEGKPAELEALVNYIK